jgi:hypothetical protein
MSATDSCSVPWNTAAETMRIAALMNRADIRATEESIEAKRIASALLSCVSRYRRVCTIEECR